MRPAGLAPRGRAPARGPAREAAANSHRRRSTVDLATRSGSGNDSSLIRSDAAPADPARPLRLALEFARAAEVDDPYAFRFAPCTYIVRTAGGGFAAAEIGWDEGMLADLQQLRGPRWDPAVVQRFGDRLRRFLAGTGWAQDEPKLIEAVRAARPIVLSVRSAAAELYALPWELMTLRATGQHVGELPGLVVRYEWPETSSVREKAVERGRILFAWSAASGAVPASEHQSAIARACALARYPFDPQRDVVAHASCERLVSALRAASEADAPFTVLHLLCHGAAHGATFGLALAGPEADDDPVVVDAGRLRQLLAPFAATLRLVVLAACDGGNIGAFGNHLGSVAQTLHRAGFQAVLASRFPLSTMGSNRLAEIVYEGLLVRRQPVEAAVTAARAALARDAARLDWASLQYYARAADGDATRPLFVRPYRGLLPFGPGDRWAFFGRDAEVAELRRKLAGQIERGEPRVCVVAGAAGLGKTSLILAGLVPALLAEREASWRFIRVAPCGAPIAELADALGRLVGAPAPSDEEGVWALLRRWTAQQPAAWLLVVVDPLEDLFVHGVDHPTRTQYVRLLWQLARAPDLRVAVVASLQLDFIGRCGEIVLDDADDKRLDQLAYDARHRVFVAQLGVPELRAAIEGPARAVGAELEAGLVERLVADVAGQPGALALLQHALELLWQRRSGRSLTLAAHDEIGGVAGALGRHADQVIVRMSPPQLRQARRALVRLAGARGEGPDTRRRLPLDELRPADAGEGEAFRAAIDALVTARLVALGEQTLRSGVKLVTAELANDTLLYRWPRLIEWIREDRTSLAELAKLEVWVDEWREHGALLDAQRLGYALEAAGRHREDVPPAVLELIRLSQAQIERERAAEVQRRGELEGMLEATQDLLRAADEDMQRAEAEIVRLRGLVRRGTAALALVLVLGLAALVWLARGARALV